MFLKKLIKKILGIKSTSIDINITYIGSKKPNMKIGMHTHINGMKIYCWNDRFNLAIGRYCSFADDITIIAGENMTKIGFQHIHLLIGGN